MSMLFDTVIHHRGPNYLLLASWVHRRREFLGLSTAAAARLAGLELSEWCALEEGWVPEELSTIRAIAGTLESLWPEVHLVAEMTRYNRPAVA
jgi:predicted transcriptional regulator